MKTGQKARELSLPFLANYLTLALTWFATSFAVLCHAESYIFTTIVGAPLGFYPVDGTNRNARFSGKAGQVVIVERSTDLINWVALSTNSLGTTPAPFNDSTSTNLAQRFYRLRLWP